MCPRILTSKKVISLWQANYVMEAMLLDGTQKLQYHLHCVRLQQKSVVCSQEEGPHQNLTMLLLNSVIYGNKQITTPQSPILS